MNHPDRQHLEQLLHAYELGALSKAEEEEFELLLLEDPELFEQVQELETATHLLRNDPDVRELLSDVLRDQESTERVLAGRPSMWRRIWPVYIAAAAVTLLLVLSDWQLEFHPSSEVTAAQNRIAIMHFRDLTDQEEERQWGAIAASLLVIDLSESQYLQVVSEQRVDDILASSQRPESQQMDRQMASTVARASNARWLLLGEVLQAQPTFAVSAQLIDVKSGDVVASELVRGQEGEDIFAVVDRLAKGIRQDLDLPKLAQREIDPSVAEVTTHSPEAYRYYLAGRNYFNKFYQVEAFNNLQKAVKLDSTFAIAYYYISQLGHPEMLKKAVRFSRQASQRDQVYIRVAEANAAGDYPTAIAELERAIRRFPDYKEFYLRLGTRHRALRNYERAIQYQQQAIAMDPLYVEAYNELAYTYIQFGQEGLALSTIDKLIAIAPNEANSWDSKGEILTALGRLDDAAAAFKQALAIKPDFHYSAFSLGFLDLRKGDYGQASQWFQSQADSPNVFARSRVKTMESLLLQVQGRFHEALTLLEKGIIEDSLGNAEHGFTLDLRQKLVAMARIYTEMGDQQAAIRTVHRAGKPGTGGRQLSISMGQVLAVNGDTAMARAWVDRWINVDNGPRRPSDVALHIDGAIAFFTRDWESAISLLSAAADESFDVYSACLLGQACLQAGKPDMAVTWLDEALHYQGTQLLSDWLFYRPMIHLHLGLSYEQQGDMTKARANYETFLELWQNADPGLKGVQQTKARLAEMSASK